MDAFIPYDGESAWAISAQALPPATMDMVEQIVETAGAGWYWPPPAKRSDGRDFPEGRPQPIKTMRQPLRVTHPAAATLPRTFIYCTDNPPGYPFRPVMALFAKRAKTNGMRSLRRCQTRLQPF